MSLKLCPLCKRECIVVAPSKIYSGVRSHFRQHVKAKEYGFCLNPECDVVYFGADTDEIYFKRDFEEEIK